MAWWAKECPPALFPSNVIENSLASLASNYVFYSGTNDLEFGTERNQEISMWLIIDDHAKDGGPGVV